MRRLWKNLWFQDPAARDVFINDTAVRIRAGILLAVPLFLSYTLYDAVYGSHWIVDGNTIQDTMDTDFDEHIIYAGQMIRKTYDYTIQSWILAYVFFEMLVSMFVKTSYLSPTIWIATFLSRRKPPVWKPLVPKRFAWTIGATFIATCWIFFNPDTFAHWINTLTHKELLSTTTQYLPYWIPLTLVWVCTGFMWLESVLGWCMGCQIHALMVKMGILEEPCEACNDIFSPGAQAARDATAKETTQS